MERQQQRPPVVPCKYDGARCIYEGLRADEPCWGDVLAPNDELEHTCEGHWGDGRYEAFDAAKHRPPRIDHEALRRAERERRERDMHTAKIGDPFEPREIVRGSLVPIGPIRGDVSLDIRITLDPGPEGQAIAAEIRAVLERAMARESACSHDWVTQYGFGCTPGSTRDTTFCSRCGARRAQSPAPAATWKDYGALADGGDEARVDVEFPRGVDKIAPATNAKTDALAEFGEQWIAELAPEQRAKVDRLVQRLRASPAPAWTREAPKEPGWYFVRHVADRERRFFAAYYMEGVWSRASGPVEHWPVRLEPPK